MNKQIEEISNLERILRVRKLDIEKQGFDVATIFYGRESEEASIARYLVGEGYHKASDIISEIIVAEQKIHGAYIHNSFSLSDEYKTGYLKATSDFLKMLFELKKKYESEGADDD